MASVAVTAGEMTDKARAVFWQHMAAAAMNLKRFTGGIFITHCCGDLSPALDAALYLPHETNGPTMHNHIAALRLYAFARMHWQRFAPRSGEPGVAGVAEAALAASAATTKTVREQRVRYLIQLFVRGSDTDDICTPHRPVPAHLMTNAWSPGSCAARHSSG